MQQTFLHHVSLLAFVAAAGFACSSGDSANTNSNGGTTANTSAAFGGATNNAQGGSLSTSSGSSKGGAATSNPSTGGNGNGTSSGCDVKPIMLTACSGLACHGSPGKPAGYNTDLFNAPSGKTIEEVLLGKTADYTLIPDPTACPTGNPELLINPTTPAESLILKKVMGTQACGVRMPNTSSGALTQEQIDCFVSWVNGATGKSGNGGAASGGTGNKGGSNAGGSSSGTNPDGTRGGSSPGSTASGGNGPRGGSTSGGSANSSGGTGGKGGSSSGGTASGSTGSRGGSNSGGSGARSAGGSGPLGGSSSGTTTSSSGIAPTFATVKTIFTENVVSCVGSDCHGGHQGRLNLLVNDGLLGRLTSATSKVCGMPIVDPGRPNNSALVKLLREGCGNVSPNCLIGTACIPRMPVGCTEGVDCIPEDYIKAVEQWITDGAKQ